jgi:hypothetical protein
VEPPATERTLNVCEPSASDEYEAGLAQVEYVPPSSRHSYELPPPALKLKLAELLALGLGGVEPIVGALSTAAAALVAAASHEL